MIPTAEVRRVCRHYYNSVALCFRRPSGYHGAGGAQTQSFTYKILTWEIGKASGVPSDSNLSDKELEKACIRSTGRRNKKESLPIEDPPIWIVCWSYLDT